ncbi:hypothetical protein D1007_25742 [Hordeum vulgare]|nr:hypothetical protein D1007_25742 [Hordeum vulgare]
MDAAIDRRRFELDELGLAVASHDLSLAAGILQAQPTKGNDSADMAGNRARQCRWATGHGQSATRRGRRGWARPAWCWGAADGDGVWPTGDRAWQTGDGARLMGWMRPAWPAQPAGGRVGGRRTGEGALYPSFTVSVRP